jgi:hypothetical protein
MATCTPKKLYRIANQFSSKAPLFVMTDEFRAPKRGEFYLSGAIPEVWQAPSDYPEYSRYRIMRPATRDEIYCPACGQRRRIER